MLCAKSPLYTNAALEEGSYKEGIMLYMVRSDGDSLPRLNESLCNGDSLFCLIPLLHKSRGFYTKAFLPHL